MVFTHIRLGPISALIRFFGVVSILGFAAVPALGDENYTTSGTVYESDSNELLYREFYTPMNGNNEVTITYAKPDGSTFATKVLTYKGEPTQPEFELHDQRDDEKTSAHFVAGRLVVSHSLNYATNERTFMNNASLVIDAGLDTFIQKNWRELTTGEEINFDYLLPKQLEAIKFQVQEIAAKDSRLYSATAPTDWRYFSITPANKFKAIFAAPVYLAYSPEKYLMRYYGRSNLDDDKGREQNVRIEYEYFNQ